jgi:three-Cys-motif partner protein
MELQMAHKFGGIWTQKKIEVLEQYLSFYVQALKNQKFNLHYADAFAGTGSHTPIDDEMQEELIPLEELKGSVLSALSVTPKFDEYHFNDLSSEHVDALLKIKQEYPELKISITQSDANEFAPHFCKSLSSNDRAVLFLDPYSTQLNWETIKYIATTSKVDMWLLFPISIILRLTPKDADKVKDNWKEILNRLLGTNDWEDALYKPIEKPPIQDMFADTEDRTDLYERINVKELEKWVSNRLKEEFAWVAEPVRLNNKGRPLFLFYFAISNKSPKAIGLAKKVANQIVKKFTY